MQKKNRIKKMVVIVETTAVATSGAEEKDGEFLSKGSLLSAWLGTLLVQNVFLLF